jgi:hypothetical protein
MTSEICYGEMIQLLRQGGIDLNEFKKRSIKTLRDLYKEICGRDVKLVLIGGRVHRIARSVKVLVTTEDGYQYLEVARRYKGKILVPGCKDYSLSETCKIGESHRQAAVAGFKEEWEIDVRPEDLNFKDWAMPDAPTTYESSVFYGILSTVYVQRASLLLPQRPWPTKSLIVVKEKNTEVYVECFKLEKP